MLLSTVHSMIYFISIIMSHNHPFVVVESAPEYLSKVLEDQRTYGIISVGAALGDDEYVQMHLQEKGDELCAEGDGIIDRIATGLASKSEKAANVASVLSLQERINYLAGTHMPSETKVLRQRVDAAL